MLSAITSRWHSRGGYKEVLVLAIPLVVTTGSTSLQSFIDRMFLSWYDAKALAATVPSAMVGLTLTALFLGLASYVGVLVAQYYGARDNAKVGAVVWQGFYTVLLSLVVVIPVIMHIVPIFRWIGHEPILQVMEVSYARVLILAIPITIISASVSGFFSGIGRTAVVMWSNLFITVLNILLDYGLIFGNWGMPAMGISGAAWATVISLAAGTTLQLWVFLTPHYRQSYMTLRHWHFNWELFRRLLRFGFPVGVQVQMQSLAWTLFVLLIGKIGLFELIAHSIAMNVFMIVVMPVVGMSVAVSVLVGQRLGAGDADAAERVTFSAIHLAAVFFIFAGIMLVAMPEYFIKPFSSGMSLETYKVTAPLVEDLLGMVALFCLFEALSMMMGGALKGAGDTRFVAITTILCSWLVLVLPTAVLVLFWDGNLHWCWSFFVLNGLVMFVLHWLRFRSAKWKNLRIVA
jgi:multidrug resistance protein, MATE family